MNHLNDVVDFCTDMQAADEGYTTARLAFKLHKSPGSILLNHHRHGHYKFIKPLKFSFGLVWPADQVHAAFPDLSSAENGSGAVNLAVSILEDNKLKVSHNVKDALINLIGTESSKETDDIQAELLYLITTSITGRLNDNQGNINKEFKPRVLHFLGLAKEYINESIDIFGGTQ
jgi:hypothetical protein